MPARYCLLCWAENDWEVSRCTHCNAPLIGPDADDMPYVAKLLLALRHSEPETRARAAALLGRIGTPDDQRVVAALLNMLRGDDSGTEPGAGRYDSGAQVEAAHSLARLEACGASASLRQVALRDETALIVTLAAIESLATLGHAGCAEAHRALEAIAREAGRSAVRTEASTALAQLNEPE